MANNTLTTLKILQETQRILENNLTFSKYINREYSKEFAQTGAKIGATVNTRRPVRSTVSEGAGLDVQDFTETYVPVVLTNQSHVDMSFTSQELTLSIDDFSNRVIKPNATSLANKIDNRGTGLYTSVPAFVDGSAPGSTLSSKYLRAGALLDLQAAPRDNQRSSILGPFAQALLVEDLKGLFQSSTKISEQYESGNMGQALGFMFSMDQNVRNHKPGAGGGTPLTVGIQGGTEPAGAIGSAGADASRTWPLITDGWSTSVGERVKAGDTFTLAGVNAVNPQNREDSGQLQTFVVTRDTSGNVTGNATIPVAPYPIFSGQYQNVTSPSGAIPDNTPLRFLMELGAATTAVNQNLVFHKDAFTLATADLIEVRGVDMYARSNYNGISMRLVRQYRIGTDDLPCRLDVLHGFKAVYPELAVRVS